MYYRLRSLPSIVFITITVIHHHSFPCLSPSKSNHHCHHHSRHHSVAPSVISSALMSIGRSESDHADWRKHRRKHHHRGGTCWKRKLGIPGDNNHHHHRFHHSRVAMVDLWKGAFEMDPNSELGKRDCTGAQLFAPQKYPPQVPPSDFIITITLKMLFRDLKSENVLVMEVYVLVKFAYQIHC